MEFRRLAVTKVHQTKLWAQAALRFGGL